MARPEVISVSLTAIPALHTIPIWCLGNEMELTGRSDAKRLLNMVGLAQESVKVMRWIDPTIELVVCGSSHQGMNTYIDWETVVSCMLIG